MAARLNRRHTEMVLKKIQASQLINRLQDHVLGVVEMKDSQIRAADILLKKVLADQKAVEHSGEIRRKAPSEMTLQELDERIARLAAREEATASGSAEPAGVH
jgi:hypothetical protein